MTSPHSTESTDKRTGPVPAERWYFRIDGKEFGPSSRSQLERFLEPPRLCQSLEVMCSEREGRWFLIAKHETIEMVLRKVGVQVEQNSAAAIRPASRLPQFLEEMRERYRRFVEGLGKIQALLWVLFAFLVVNGVVFYFLSEGMGRERKILARYESLLEATRQFDPKTAKEEDWRRFADGANAEIEPMVRQLQRTASRHRPIQQNLLFAGRDYFTKLFQAAAPPAADSNNVKVIEKYLSLVREQLPE